MTGARHFPVVPITAGWGLLADHHGATTGATHHDRCEACMASQHKYLRRPDGDTQVPASGGHDNDGRPDPPLPDIHW